MGKLKFSNVLLGVYLRNETDANTRTFMKMFKASSKQNVKSHRSVKW